MSKTEFNPKSSTISPAANTGDVKPQHAPEEKSARAKDIYQTSAGDPYRGLVSGNPKAAKFPLDELTGLFAPENKPVKMSRDPMQRFIKETFAGGDPYITTPSSFESVNVPNFFKDIAKRTPGIERGTSTMKPVVNKYKNLKELIETLIAQTNASLKTENAKNMSYREIRALQERRGYLDKKLAECVGELSKAEYYLTWAKKNETAAKAKKAAEEKE